jgi:hypothetical protein
LRHHAYLEGLRPCGIAPAWTVVASIASGIIQIHSPDAARSCLWVEVDN